MRVIFAKRKTESFPVRGIFRAPEPSFGARIGLFSQDAAGSRCGRRSAGTGGAARSNNSEVLNMLGWVVTFLVIALIAGILGFGGVAGASIEIAKIIFFIAIVLFLVSAIVGVVRGRRI
jgi:uncharacterized membrane protein YtjA (UPF0391 family)